MRRARRALRLDAPPPRLLLPGAFNPLHEGHRGLALAAERLTGHTATFELSVVNVDKPPLAAEEVRRRLQHFPWRFAVWLTRAPRFTEKASLFPGSTFVVGADTAARLLSPRYYEEADAGLTRALEHIRAQGCRFLVAGRACEGRPFAGLRQLAVPVGFSDLFTEIPETLFRHDISSTALTGGQCRSLDRRLRHRRVDVEFLNDLVADVGSSESVSAWVTVAES